MTNVKSINNLADVALYFPIIRWRGSGLQGWVFSPPPALVLAYLRGWDRAGSAVPDTPCSVRSWPPRHWCPRRSTWEFSRTLALLPRCPVTPWSPGCWGSYTGSARDTCPRHCPCCTAGGTYCTPDHSTPNPESPHTKITTSHLTSCLKTKLIFQYS